MATSSSTSQDQICLMCKKKCRDDCSVFCRSCALEYPYCYECGEKERNFPYKLCSDCYSKTRTERRAVKGKEKQQ